MIWSVSLVLSMFLFGMLLADMQYLQTNVIRLRVVAASDSEYDQGLKLKVKDAVTNYLNTCMTAANNVEEAKSVLASNLDALNEVATAVLSAEGSRDSVRVYMSKEGTNERVYDTFRLPSGIYETLRIDIGSAQGENWWCVVFPSLCLPETEEGFRSAAVSAGFDSGLTDALTEQEEFEVRFFLLDCIGKIEKIIFGS